MNTKEMNENDRIILQKRLRERRLFLDMTYQDLANKTGLSKSTLQRYERGGIHNLPMDKIFALSEALEVNPGYFNDLSNDYTDEPINNDIFVNRFNREEYLEQIKNFEKKALDKLTPSLISNGYKVVQEDHGSVGDLVAIKGSEFWHMDFLYMINVKSYPVGMGMQRNQILMRLGRLAVYDKPITKYSIILENRSIAESLISQIHPRHIDIKISIILLTNDGYEELNLI